MAYCGQANSTNAKYLASKTGLDPTVALAWLLNECQSIPNPTNPLNIRYGGYAGQIANKGGFGVYGSTNAGLDAAAWEVNNSAYYGGIRAAIKTGDPFKQAQAIQNSPWAGGHYGYAHIADTVARLLGRAVPAGINGKIGLPSAPAIPTAQQASTGGTTFTADQWNNFIACWMANGTILHISAGDIPGAVSCAAKNGISFGGIDLTTFIGKSPSDLRDAMAAKGAIPPADLGKGIIPDVPGAIASLGAALTTVATYLVAVVIIVVGIWLYSKGQVSKVETSQAPQPGRLRQVGDVAGGLAAG